MTWSRTNLEASASAQRGKMIMCLFNFQPGADGPSHGYLRFVVKIPNEPFILLSGGSK